MEIVVCFVQGTEYVVNGTTIVPTETITIPATGTISKSTKKYAGNEAGIR